MPGFGNNCRGGSSAINTTARGDSTGGACFGGHRNGSSDGGGDEFGGWGGGFQAGNHGSEGFDGGCGGGSSGDRRGSGRGRGGLTGRGGRSNGECGGGFGHGGGSYGGGSGRGGVFGGRNAGGGGRQFGGPRDNFPEEDESGGHNRSPHEFTFVEERACDVSHVPRNRTIDEILEDDLNAAESYTHIREEDDEIVCISGFAGIKMEMKAIIGTWAEANFDQKLLDNIARSKYIVPRKIQSQAIPRIIEGIDLKGHAETGSGKSAAFLLPTIDKVMKRKTAGEFKSKRSTPFALIIVPTRELVIQLWEQAIKLSDQTGVSVAKTYGKYRFKDNCREISLGCDILIGTTGRIVHLFEERWPDGLKVLILDEADHLLDDQFARDLRRMERIPGFPKKEDRQTLLFSATFSPEVQIWSEEWLRESNVFISNKKPTSANSRIIQQFLMVAKHEKSEKLVQFLRDLQIENKGANGEAASAEEKNKVPKTLVFVNTKRQADVTALYLSVNKFKATTINSDRPQKLREEALLAFRQGKIDVIVSTDVCSRGIDIKELDHVINMDLPEDLVSYVYRIGRTGRLREGTATSFFDPLSDLDVAPELARIIREADQEVPQFIQDAADGKPINVSMFGRPADSIVDPPITAATVSLPDQEVEFSERNDPPAASSVTMTVNEGETAETKASAEPEAILSHPTEKPMDPIAADDEWT